MINVWPDVYCACAESGETATVLLSFRSKFWYHHYIQWPEFSKREWYFGHREDF